MKKQGISLLKPGNTGSLFLVFLALLATTACFSIPHAYAQSEEVVSGDGSSLTVPDSSENVPPPDPVPSTIAPDVQPLPWDAITATGTQQPEASSSAPNPIWDFIIHPFHSRASSTEATATGTATSTSRFDWKSFFKQFHGDDASSTDATTTDPGTSGLFSKFKKLLGLDGLPALDEPSATTTLDKATSTPRIPPVKVLDGPADRTHLLIKGTVTSVSNNSISVTLDSADPARSGTKQKTVTVSSIKDAYHGSGPEAAVGNSVEISALKSSDGTIAAQFIRVRNDVRTTTTH